MQAIFDFVIVWSLLHTNEIGMAIFFASIIMCIFLAIEKFGGGDDDAPIY